jgi:hypothetical protein
MKRHKKEPDTIAVNCTIPDKLRLMLDDYRIIANHLLSFGLYAKSRNERELRDITKPWFLKHYSGKYAIHYLDSAASFASQQIESWRSLGGDIATIPHIGKSIARLNNDLYTIKEMASDGTMLLRITIAPHESVLLPIKVNHRHFSEWIFNRPGTLIILPDGIRLCFTPEATTPPSSESVAVDLNFDRVTMARSDGQMKQFSIHKITDIQRNQRRKRTSIQRTLWHNPKKAERLLTGQRGRERNRVKDLLHKKIHGRNNELLKFVGNRVLGFEDLSNCTDDVLRLNNGKRFNSKMSSWIHGEFRRIAEHHHPHHRVYYTRGTSRFCPFDNTPLSHPIWKQSKCETCGRVYDRDWLEALSGLIRLNSKHKKGAPWATVAEVFPSLENEFRQQLSCAPYSVPTRAPYSADMPIRGLSQTWSEPVRPECAVLSPESPSVTDADQRIGVVQENRDEAAIRTQKSGDDAKKVTWVVDERLDTGPLPR